MAYTYLQNHLCVDQQKNLLAKTQMKFSVTKIFCRMNIIAIASLNNIYLLQLTSLKLIYKDECSKNKKGILDISSSAENLKICYTDIRLGFINIYTINGKTKSSLKAFDFEIGNVAITHNGKRIASSSIQSNFIRFHNTFTNQLIQQVKVSHENIKVLYMQFNLMNTWFACVTQNKQVQIFVANLLKEQLSKNNIYQTQNPKSSFAFLSSVFNSFQGQFKFAYCNLEQELNYSLEFATQYTLFVMSNKIIKVIKFDPIHGGKCKIQAQIKLHEIDKDINKTES